LTIAVDISWVDEFAREIAEYVYVRERDNLLIMLPNQAYKLNSSGVVILKRALAGESVVDILESKSTGLSQDTNVILDVHSFFCDIRALVMGCLGEGQGRRAVETVPFERPHNCLPVLSEIALTYRCNLNCACCYAGCRCGKLPRGREMTTAEIKRILDIIRYEAEVPSVSWTGGEPTMRDDLVELTGYATSIGLRVNLITNGTLLTKKTVADLRNAGLKSAQVSLEGGTAEVHDRITGVVGSFDRTLTGIRLLKDAGLHVHTNTTMNKLNAKYLTELLKTIQGVNLKRCSMNLVIPSGSALKGDILLTYSEAAPIVEETRRTAREMDVEFLWYSPTPYCIYNPIAARLGAKSCAACDGLLSVAPNGDVLPCSSLPKSIGNLLKSPFERVWRSRKAKYWRNKRYAHKVCKECGQFSLCTGACPIYWQFIGYQELASSGRM